MWYVVFSPINPNSETQSRRGRARCWHAGYAVAAQACGRLPAGLSWPTLPSSRSNSTCPARPRHRAGAANSPSCSDADSLSCACRKSNPDIFVMQSAETGRQRIRLDGAKLNQALVRNVRTRRCQGKRPKRPNRKAESTDDRIIGPLGKLPILRRLVP